MKKILMFFWCVAFCTLSLAQTPISLKNIIDSIDWNEATETDIVYMFKNNVYKQDVPNKKIGGYCTSYSLKNISVGKYLVPKSDVLVDNAYRKVKRINIIFPENSSVWNNPNELETNIVDTLTKILGEKYSKTETNHGKGIKDVTYCWNDSFVNPCNLTFWFCLKSKVCAILVGNEVKM